MRWLALLFLGVGVAAAQTNPPSVPYNPAWLYKVDVRNGTLTNPTITTPTISGATLSSPTITTPTITGGTAFTGGDDHRLSGGRYSVQRQHALGLRFHRRAEGEVMPYYLVFDAHGALIGSGFASDDLALPEGATSCTQDEYATAPAVALHNGAIIPIPAVAVVPIALAHALVQSARNAILAGLTIISTGTPAINGVYPCQGSTWEYLKDEATFITTFGSFSTGTPSIVFTLPDGRAVQFSSTALMLAVVKAIGMYLTSLAIIEAANAGVLPAASVTIT